jgi:hypothetical protein
VPLRSIALTTTCSVLRCDNPGADVLTGPKETFEAFVCTAHKAEADAGSPWGINKDHALVMGDDMPAGLGKWTLEESEAPGIILTLETDRKGDKPFSMYLTKDSMAVLANVLTSRS